ncbi:proline dehydrogenase family protein [Cellulomonas sp. NTE-D12]|uniref:proline dehydrogenase family protein n=1 Tax=Cellulomonas sp. NTE-D12 TaxID=2962632 RepID=UPI0030821B55
MDDELLDLVPDVEALVRRWLDEAADVPPDRGASLLAGLLRDPAGLRFAVGFIDRVVRPEDPAAAARALATLSRDVPGFLPAPLRWSVRAGGLAGPVAPGVVVPVARRVLRELVGHLVVDASDAHLGAALAHLRRDGVALNLNLLGEAVLGRREADRRLEGTARLLERTDVDHVSIKVSSVSGPHAPWAFDATVDEVVEHLLPLYRRAAATGTVVTLDMEEYRDLDLTLEVFMRLLDRPELRDLHAGVVLQAYLPDALGAMQRLQEWAAARRAGGGAPVKVRLVKGANLSMEHVDAELHDWPPATWDTKQQTDTAYKRVLDWALTPERTANVHLGVAGHNLFDLAFAWLLAGRRGVQDAVEMEMLLGMATGQAEAVRRSTGRLLLYTPVVHPEHFDVAIAYLVRRLEEAASPENVMSSLFTMADDDGAFARERDRFLVSLRALVDARDEVPAPRRTQDRRRDAAASSDARTFASAPDTDPSLAPNRQWARELLARVPSSHLGVKTRDEHTVTDPAELDRILAAAVAAGTEWGTLPARERATVLRRAADELERRRGDLCEVMAAETGKTLDQADPEVSEAVDFARWYAGLAEELEGTDGAVAHPVRLTVATPPWNFPVSIAAGSVLAPLAAGSAVVLKPAPQAARCGSVLAEALWAAGVPREVLALVHVAEDGLGKALVSDARVDRLLLTGSFETARLFAGFRPGLHLLAETSGKNAIVVTPSADLDLAVRDVVASAFGHAGQKCSAASLVILVGSVGTSRRFHDQLLDAVTSLRVGLPADPATQMGPVIEPAEGKLLDGLTRLAPGESWAVRPRRLDDAGRLWTPGVRAGVRAGSAFHRTEYFGPVLGVMTAETLDEAIDLQNGVDYGLTAGLHSQDVDEVAHWLTRVEAGNLYVNRGITGAIVRRQPFGGWKRSAVGPGAKAGGPNTLVPLVDWASAPARHGAPLGPAAARLLEAARAAGVADAPFAHDEADFRPAGPGQTSSSASDGAPVTPSGDATPAAAGPLERALASDAQAWRDVFSRSDDVTGLGAERNVLRYRPVPVLVRLGRRGSVAALVRVVGAGLVAGAEVTVSTSHLLPAPLGAVLHDLGVTVRAEDDTTWLAAVRTLPSGRIRLVDGDADALAHATGPRPDLAVYHQPVTESGRVELLTFLREQSVTVTAHRFGTPDTLADRALQRSAQAGADRAGGD